MLDAWMACQHSVVRAGRIAAVPDEVHQACGCGGHFFCLGFSQGRVCGGEKAEQNPTDRVAAGTALMPAGTVGIKDKISL